MKIIKYFIWFFKESKKFTGYSYKRIIFKENGFKKALSFAKICKNGIITMTGLTKPMLFI